MNSPQQEIFLDAREAMARRDAAVALVATGKGRETFIQLAVEEIESLPPGTRFTTDVLWVNLPAPPEPRVMGAVMVRARKNGLVKHTEQYRPSARPAAHRNPKRVWERLP